MLRLQMRMMTALLVSVAMFGLGTCGLAQPQQNETAVKKDPFAPMVRIRTRTTRR